MGQTFHFTAKFEVQNKKIQIFQLRQPLVWTLEFSFLEYFCIHFWPSALNIYNQIIVAETSQSFVYVLLYFKKRSK